MAYHRPFCSLILVLLTVISAAKIVKGGAPDGKLYVLGKRSGCKAVQSQEPCPVSWDLPTTMADIYKSGNDVVNITISTQLPDADKSCQDAVKAVFCTQVAPKCLEDGSTADFGDINKLCEKAESSCVGNEAASMVCKLGNLIKGKHKFGSCSAPTKPVQGACPQPKYKLGEIELELYKSASMDVSQIISLFPPGRRNPIFDDECLEKLKTMMCMEMACSIDEKRLLIKDDYRDCEKVIKNCTTSSPGDPLPRVIAREMMKENMYARCEIYPNPDKNVVAMEDAPPVIDKNTPDSGLKTVETLRTEHPTTKRPSSKATNNVLHNSLLCFVFILFKMLTF